MILFDMPTIDPPPVSDHVDQIKPRHNVRLDATFWQHRSVFAGSQEQLDELRRDAEQRAVQRARGYFAEYLASEHANTRPSTLELHRPAIRCLKPVVHVGLIPLLWAITTCKCGDRWPCNDIKQYLRRRLGWTTDITEPLKQLTQRLPKPSTRFSRLRRALSRWRRKTSDSPTSASCDRSTSVGVGGSRA